MSDKLDRAIADAKKAFAPKTSDGAPPDWDAIGEKLFDRIDAHDRTEEGERVQRLRGQPRAWGAVAATLAVAAAVALFIARGKNDKAHAPLVSNGSSEGASAVESAGAMTSALVSRQGTGDVLVGGAPLVMGGGVRAGDVIETRGATAVFEHDKRAVAWTLEDRSRVALKKTSGPLVVALEEGAVEAQVRPVATGEAFAVDVAAPGGAVTRVAVHGTHLRVARVENASHAVRIVVDLTEGIVSIGAPPRAGSTYGTLVTAPAHVELDPADALGTLTVSHTPENVRAPVDVAGMVAAAPAKASAASSGSYPASGDPNAPLARPATGPIAQTPGPGPQAGTSANAAHASRAVDPNPERTVSAAVRACMAAHPSSHLASGAPDDSAQLKVTVSSALELRVNDEGTVELARFDPPLPPDVQTCAASTIYKTRFAKGGTIRIALDF